MRARLAEASPALRFVLIVGAMSFFADLTYEGARSIIGQYFAALGAGALAIATITGLGEALGYVIRLPSGRQADRTGRHWPIAIGGYILQMAVVPLLAVAGSWQVAAVLVILERVGKAIRNPPRDAMLSHAAKEMGYGWGFGVHEALDQFGALCGPLIVALILALSRHDYQLAFAALAVPTVIMWSLLGLARRLYPRPRDLEPGVTDVPGGRFPRIFWLYVLAAALVAAGFADFPLMAYRFTQTGTVSGTFTAVTYAMAMAVSGAGSLLFGRIFDRVGIRVLVPLTVVTALYAPLVFLGGLWSAVAGVCLWGLGMGVHESIMPAAVAPMVPASRRASAYGTFTAAYGLSWFAGSVVIGALFDVSMGVVVLFTLVAQLVALPLIVAVARARAGGAASA